MIAPPGLGSAQPRVYLSIYQEKTTNGKTPRVSTPNIDRPTPTTIAVPAHSTAVAAAAACLLLFVLVKRRSSAKSLLEQERRSARSASARVSLMDDDDVITAVLGQLQQQHGVEAFTAAACVNRQFGRLAALDLFWRELCARRWDLYPDAPHYRTTAEADIAAAQGAATEAPPQGGAPAAAASWRGAYVKREAELERNYPCFCMPGNLR